MISEQERLEQLRGLNFGGVEQDVALQQLLAFIEAIFEVPAVRVHLIDEDRQIGLCGTGNADPFNLDRDASVCTHTIRQDETLIMRDMREDPFFGDHQLVTGSPYMRFYAGAVIRAPGGAAVGSLCLIDYVPRDFSDEDERLLIRAARQVEYHVTGGGPRSLHGAAPGVDPATQLADRTAVTGRLEPALAAARNHDHPVPSTLVTVSLDDVAGLQAGGRAQRADQILHGVVDNLRAALPSQAGMGRWDSGELIVWAPSDIPGCDRHGLGETVANALEEPIAVEGGIIRANGSIAVVKAPDDGETLFELTSLLNNLSRHTTGSTRVRLAHFANDHVELNRQVDLGQRLDEALARGTIRPYFQPRYHLADGSLSGLEALARWHDPELGWISPGEFIPLAERTGRADEITQLMVQAVCDQILAWTQQGYTAPQVAVNISPDELRAGDFPSSFVEQVRRGGVDPGNVELEITERGFIEDMDWVADRMRELAAFGTPLAIDDFGTGYSSLLYLQQLPAQYLKIDKGFVDHVHDDHATANIVRGMVGIARALDMSVIAEGVETGAQAAALGAHGVDHGQGFLFARPMPAEAITKLLTTPSSAAMVGHRSSS